MGNWDSSYDFFVQGIGIVGLMFGAAAFQSNRCKNIVLLKLMNDMFFSLQYLLLGAWSGAVMNIISCLRNLIYVECEKRGKSTRGWMFFFVAVMVISAICSWTSPLSLVAMIGKVFSTISYGLKKPEKVRLFTLPSSLCWLIYDGFYHSAGGVVNQLLVISSILVSMVRFDILKKEKGE